MEYAPIERIFKQYVGTLSGRIEASNGVDTVNILEELATFYEMVKKAGYKGPIKDFRIRDLRRNIPQAVVKSLKTICDERTQMLRERADSIDGLVTSVLPQNGTPKRKQTRRKQTRLSVETRLAPNKEYTRAETAQLTGIGVMKKVWPSYESFSAGDVKELRGYVIYSSTKVQKELAKESETSLNHVKRKAHDLHKGRYLTNLGNGSRKSKIFAFKPKQRKRIVAALRNSA